eukprot:TRINITY_DN37444_c0_g1_i1.p1 TRINITY_DN37444_c0_g1~~TRINITY_DN37444_c0_g1_i1.p1  ORF type:complete len:611 (-),score=136.10 TRINITY_DN37444_c0_g1_i1:45-1820(-)
MDLPLGASIPIILVLVMMSGLFSGLTLGLLGLDKSQLELVMKAGSEKDAKCAEKIYPIRCKGNLLLCTLLLGNTAVNVVLATLMDKVFAGFVGMIVSTILIVIFGEILPQATCSQFALQIGAAATPIVTVVMALMYIVAKPISLALDLILGEEIGTTHSKRELMELMRMQMDAGIVEAGAAKVVHGALACWDKTIDQAMTPINKVFMIDADRILDANLLAEIHAAGFSRVPVCNASKEVIGMLLSKDLLVVNPNDCLPVSVFLKAFPKPVVKISRLLTVGECLRALQERRMHMALVMDDGSTAANVVGSNSRVTKMASAKRSITARDSIKMESLAAQPVKLGECVGLITHEDLLEQIFQEDFLDESDGRRRDSKRLEDLDGAPSLSQKLANRWGSVLPSLLGGQPNARRLSEYEVQAIAKRLPEAGSKEVQWPAEPALAQALREAAVTTFSRSGGVRDSLTKKDWLFSEGEALKHCLVVLSGRVRVERSCGGDRCVFHLGTFGVLGSVALGNPEAVADFSACIADTEVRALVLTRDLLQNVKVDVPVETNASTASSMVEAHIAEDASPLLDKKAKKSKKKSTIEENGVEQE